MCQKSNNVFKHQYIVTFLTIINMKYFQIKIIPLEIMEIGFC